MPGNENANSDPFNFQSLQEDAIRRAREMQSRAHIPAYYPAASARPQEGPHPHTEQLPIHETERPPEPDPGPDEEPPGAESGLLDSLLKDHERTLIWVLILILMEEKADTALIFALMYLAT